MLVGTKSEGKENLTAVGNLPKLVMDRSTTTSPAIVGTLTIVKNPITMATEINFGVGIGKIDPQKVGKIANRTDIRGETAMKYMVIAG